MLLQFRVENHRSLRDDQTLSLVASSESGDRTVRRPPGLDLGVLPAVAVYGANASGKSNVLGAMALLRHAVLLSHRSWDPAGGVPVEPFALRGRATASTFEVDILLDSVRVRYGFTASAERVEREWLHRWPNARKQTLFEREGDEVDVGRHMPGENEAVKALMRPNSLFLSVGAQNNHPVLMPLFSWFRDVAIRNAPLGSPYASLGLLQALGSTQLSLFSEDEETQKAALLDLLQAADTGIIDIRVEEREAPISERARSRRDATLSFKHRGTKSATWLPLEVQSSGTRTLLEIGARMFPVLRRGGLLCVDELEASLHPMLAARLLELFQDRKTNPRGAQLLFTTHDTNLIGTIESSPLRRDQVWFTEKDQGGATKLYPLTDYKPRKEENLERGYLQGRYGAIPFLGELRSLGGK